MKTSLAFAAIISTVFLARTAGAQQRFTGVEYIAGRTELARPFEATLVLDDHELRIEETVYSRQGRSVRTVFTIPLTDITDVGASLDGEAGVPVLTGRFGLSSPTDHHEYVTLTMAVGDRIEGVRVHVDGTAKRRHCPQHSDRRAERPRPAGPSSEEGSCRHSSTPSVAPRATCQSTIHTGACTHPCAATSSSFA